MHRFGSCLRKCASYILVSFRVKRASIFEQKKMTNIISQVPEELQLPLVSQVFMYLLLFLVMPWWDLFHGFLTLV